MGHSTNRTRRMLYNLLVWRESHETASNMIFWSIALALMLAMSVGFPFSIMVNNVLYPIFIIGTPIFAFGAAEKIKKLQKKQGISKIISWDIEHLQHVLNIVITLSVAIAGIGLAAFVFNINQSPLPAVAIKTAGMAIEIITTVFFAALYWRLFFYLFETRSVDQAAKWAGWLSFVPIIIGAYVTVNISIFFKLDAIQDSAASLIPFLLVYYTMSRSIPTYDLVINRPIETELESLAKESKLTAKELKNPILKSRKNYLKNKVEKLSLRKQQLETARLWLKDGDTKIDEIHTSLQQFVEKNDKIRQQYRSKVGRVSNNGIAVFCDDEVLIFKRLSALNYRLISNISTCNCQSKRESISEFFTYFELMSQNLITIQKLPLVNFEFQAHERSKLAGIEVSNDDIPELCRNFDRKHLDEYSPAYISFQVDSYKTVMAFQFLKFYPSISLASECKQILSELHASIVTLIDKTKERICDYERLETEFPDSHIVKDFQSWGGSLGVSSLQSNLVSLQSLENSLNSWEQKTLEFRQNLKID
jgi:hypothetical protein